MSHKRNSGEVFVFILVLGISFAHFSFYYSPLLNSDSALSILMAHHLQLPQDLYCWGQDRGGNLIPIVAYMVNKLSGIPLILVTSLTHYGILLLGVLSFSSFIKNRYLRIFLYLIWFLPPWQFVEFLLYPFGIQFSFFGIILYCLKKVKQVQGNNSQYYWMACTALATAILIWVSDFGIIYVAAIVLGLLFSNPQILKRIKNRTEYKLWIISSIILVGSFIIFAKLQGIPSNSYSSFRLSTLSEIGNGLEIIWASVKRILLFRSESSVQGVFWIAIITTLASYFFYVKTGRRKKGTTHLHNTLTSILFVTLILTAVILFTVNWVYLNEMGRRYFSCLFISAALWLLAHLDSHPGLPKWMAVSLLVCSLLSVSSALENFYRNGVAKAIRTTVQELESLGKIGLIGDYWNSYVNSAVNPDLVIATPHDNAVYRNIKLAEAVFENDKIFLIRDMWLDTFPTRVRQFGRILIKDGAPFKLADSEMCKYKLSSDSYNFSYRAHLPNKIRIKSWLNGTIILPSNKLFYRGYPNYDSLSTIKQSIKISDAGGTGTTKTVKCSTKLSSGIHEIKFSLRKQSNNIREDPALNCTISSGESIHLNQELDPRKISHSRFSEYPVRINLAEGQVVDIVLEAIDDSVLFLDMITISQ